VFVEQDIYLKRLLPRVVVIVLLVGVAIYFVASALGVQRGELLGYFLASVSLVVASMLTAAILFGVVRLFKR